MIDYRAHICVREPIYVGLMLGHRLRRWPNIKPSYGVNVSHLLGVHYHLHSTHVLVSEEDADLITASILAYRKSGVSSSDLKGHEGVTEYITNTVWFKWPARISW